MNVKESLQRRIRAAQATIKQGMTKVVSDIRHKPLRLVAVMIVSVVLGIVMGPRAGVLWLLFLSFAVYEWENRVVGVLALVSLASCPVLLSLNQNDWAEVMAEWAYFFLVITVILQLIEYKRHPDRFAEEGDTEEEPTKTTTEASHPEPEIIAMKARPVKLFAFVEKLTPKTIRIILIVAVTCLAIVILGKLLLPGYVLTLDMLMVPKIPWPTIQAGNFLNAYPFKILLFIFGLALPGWVVQKITLLALFIAIPSIAYHFLVETDSRVARIWVALAYTLNPFVYTRFLAGQWMILCAYALLPLVVTFAKKRSPWLGAILALVFLFSIHLGVMALLIAAITAFASTPTTKQTGKKRWIAAGIVMGSFLVLTSYWTMPYLFHQDQSILNVFDIRHEVAFRTAGDGAVGVLTNVLGGYGFWAERDAWAKQFAWAKSVPVLAIPTGLILAGMIIFGFIALVRRKETSKYAMAMLTIGIAAFIFSCGVGDSPFRDVNQWLFDHIGFWRGFRDSQKWSSVVMMIYVALGGAGIAALQSITKPSRFVTWTRKGAVSLAFIAIPLYSFPMLFGFWNQLHPVWYPQAWEKTNALVEQQKDCKALFLPWHAYLSYQFENNITIANPAKDYFHCTMVMSRDIGLGDIKDQTIPDPAYDAIAGVVTGSDGWTPDQAINVLKEAGIHFAIVANDVPQDDPYTYEFLRAKDVRAEDFGEMKLYTW